MSGWSPEARAAWNERNREKQREYQKRWYEKNKAKEAIKKRVRKYGLTPEQIDALGVICMMCGDPGTDIDHCHETGTVRGLLCRYCNLGLGYFRDDPTRLERALDYLKRCPVQVAASPTKV